ncbi:MAG: TonB-dependent receptor [Bacteroidetes bacterium]|nr:TonB-dependent receptor [Bacteroidota bacterium]
MKRFSLLSLFTLLFVASATVAFAQRTVVGTVTSGSDNSPLIGATILVKGSDSGTITDIDGSYSIRVTGNDAVLVVSYTGYETQEVAVGSQVNVDVALAESSTSLSEVVVTGYSSQSRRDIAGSVAVVDTKDMTKFASSNFAEQLQGKVAGVQISSSGDPGAASFVRVRGFGTINNNEPLYVIDGIPVSNEASLNFLNPNDIESMQVLKDASAASVYGSRGGNGVIVITTKHGRLGKAKVSLNVFTGTQSPGKTPDLLDPAGLLELGLKSAEGAGQPFSSGLYVNTGDANNPNWVLPDYIVRGGGFTGGVLEGDPKADSKNYFLTSDPLGLSDNNYLIQKANHSGTNWFDELFSSHPVRNYQVAVNGGTESGNYYISANYYDHEGIMLLNDYERYQTRVNTEFKVKNTIKIGQSLNVSYQTGHGGIGNPSEGSSLINSYRMPQLVPVRDIEGNYGGSYGTFSNAATAVAAQERNYQNNSHSIRTMGSLYAEVTLLKYLTAKSQASVDYSTGRGKFYTFRNWEHTEVNAANSLNENQYTNTNWVWFNTLSFNKDVTEDINLSALVGTSAAKNHYIGFNASGSKLDFGDDPFYRVLNNVNSATYSLGGYEGENSKFSIFGTLNLNFFDKYLLQGVLRRDGSSKFINNQYGTFYGGSLAWRLSEESFLKDVDAITDLKLRAGYGVTGNDEASGDYPGFSPFYPSTGEASYNINGDGGSVALGFQQGGRGNPDLKWETTKMLNLGFDLSLFKQLDIIFEWYDRRTEDLIYPQGAPWTLGSPGQQNINIGDMKNTGIDLNLNYKGKAAGGALGWTAGLTFSKYENEVLALDANDNTFVRNGGSRIGNITYTTAGQPISQFYGFEVDGLWASQEEINSVLFENAGDAKPGRFKYVDQNGDGQITADDETIIGSPHPDFTYGLNFSLDYKGFDFTAYFQGTQGNEIFNYVKYFSHTPAFQANYAKEMLTEAGKSLPVLDNTDNYSNQRNSWYVEDGSYFRLRNLQLGYTLGADMLGKIGIDKLRIYVQGQNLFTVTDYSGLDPDVSVRNIQEGYTQQRDYDLGVDHGHYPTVRTLLIGINADF